MILDNTIQRGFQLDAISEKCLKQGGRLAHLRHGQIYLTVVGSKNLSAEYGFGYYV